MKKRDFKEELDMSMASVKLSEERRRAILSRGPRQAPVQADRKSALAAVLGRRCHFWRTGRSAQPAEILGRALGDFEPASQVITGAQDEDNGIVVRAVSALSDRSYAKIYLEVQDTTGDRSGRKDLSGRYPWNVRLVFGIAQRRHDGRGAGIPGL